MAPELKSQYNIKRCTTIEDIIQNILHMCDGVKFQYHKLNGKEKQFI